MSKKEERDGKINCKWQKKIELETNKLMNANVISLRTETMFCLYLFLLFTTHPANYTVDRWSTKICWINGEQVSKWLNIWANGWTDGQIEDWWNNNANLEKSNNLPIDTDRY